MTPISGVGTCGGPWLSQTEPLLYGIFIGLYPGTRNCVCVRFRVSTRMLANLSLRSAHGWGSRGLSGMDEVIPFAAVLVTAHTSRSRSGGLPIMARPTDSTGARVT